jgi:hypothetical protein
LRAGRKQGRTQNDHQKKGEIDPGRVMFTSQARIPRMATLVRLGIDIDRARHGL